MCSFKSDKCVPVARGRREFSSFVVRASQVKVRACLLRIHFGRLFPGIDGFAGMAEPRSEQTIVDQRLGIARKESEHFLVVRVSVGVASVFNQRTGAGMLQPDIGRIDFDGAFECGGRLTFVAGKTGCRGDTCLH